jgi:polypeptide N-acetylgalactosaminyltransferase
LEKNLEAKSRKKDWHDYKKIAEDAQRKGPGEQGAGFTLTEEDSKSGLKKSLYAQNGFNALVSDRISLERSLNDIRHAE